MHTLRIRDRPATTQPPPNIHDLLVYASHAHKIITHLIFIIYNININNLACMHACSAVLPSQSSPQTVMSLLGASHQFLAILYYFVWRNSEKRANRHLALKCVFLKGGQLKCFLVMYVSVLQRGCLIYYCCRLQWKSRTCSLVCYTMICYAFTLTYYIENFQHL